jgi:GDP-4-dehydro-6-deoxy-D-mannose reductase
VRVFLTGLTGFVGRWLAAELRDHGHEVLPDLERAGGPRIDVGRSEELTDALRTTGPEAVVHLAAVSAAREAAEDPQRAFAVAVGGTTNLLEAVRTLPSIGAVLVVSSSEVYGAPQTGELPLTEASPLRPRGPYALSKVAQESVALAYAARLELPLAVARSFNHIGPGQRPVFVVPSLAQRILLVRRGEASDIPIGNLDVRRDFTDVRDVARAYRLMLERLADGSLKPGGQVLNVASGQAVSIRQVVALLCTAAGVADPGLRVDPQFVRGDDPEEIRGDAAALRTHTGWRPEFTLEQTLRDVWQDVSAGRQARSP